MRDGSTSTTSPRARSDGAQPNQTEHKRLQVDMSLLQGRKDQFLEARGLKVGELRKHKVVLDFDAFLKSTPTGAQSWIVATDEDVVNWLCFLDTHGNGTTVVHQHGCQEFGTKHWGSCSRTLGCTTRYAAASMEKGFVSKLRVAYADIWGRTSYWSKLDRAGNPVASALVTHYVAFTHEEQKKSGIVPRQAPAMLRPELTKLLSSMRTHLAAESQAHRRIALARDIAIFAIAFHTGRRGDDLQHALGSSVLQLPQNQGFIINFQFGKTLRVGGAQAVPICVEEKFPAICPVGALQQYVEATQSCKWDMSGGYHFPDIDVTSPIQTARRSSPVSPQCMTSTHKTRRFDR